MKGLYLGEFQEIVLLSILLLGHNAYGVSIQEEINSRLNRNISRGALHAALTRLEDKGYISSRIGGASPTRGGRSKKFYALTNTGTNAVEQTRDIRMSLWGAILKTSN
jgi:DNA-binding PadR family transcriptional regulator